MTHTDAHNILRAIIAEPDDDLHRLAYADHLLEHGDEQEQALGEFIQVQAAIARDEPEYYLTCTNSGREVNSAIALHRRAAELLGRAWLLPLNTLECWEICSSHTEFRRGFPHTVRATEKRWIDSSYKIVRYAPVQRVDLDDKKPLYNDDIRSYIWVFGRDAKWNGPSRIYDRIHRCLKVSRSPTESLALDALSDACLKYARDMCGAKFRIDQSIQKVIQNLQTKGPQGIITGPHT